MPNVTPTFKMQSQLQTQWCWTAVATSTAAFYNSGTRHTQCEVVNAVLQLSICCCAQGSNAQCDVPHSLERAFRHVGHWRQTFHGAASWTTLDAEVRSNQPVGAQISLIGGNAHFVAVVGTGTRKDDKIVVEDPLNGRTTTKHKLFAKSAHGIWRETYFTQR
jgi:hypothetical protein